MQPLMLRDIVAATGGTLIAGDPMTKVTNVCTDSRKISAGDLFIPLKGERFDGHDYIPEALNKGAAGFLTGKDISVPEGKFAVKVADPLKALGDLARYYRSKLKIKMIGVTGSVGKTSTKDMIACVLSRRFLVSKTEGNFNNEIGLPKTILNLNMTHKVAVVEMGMRGLGEISYLTSIAKPDIAVITNIGMSHIERLGSRQNILKAKLEILEGLSPGGLVVLNGDDAMLYGLKGLLKFRTVFYGLGGEMDYTACNIRVDGKRGTFFDIRHGNNDYSAYVPTPGVHNVYNALAAIAVGFEMGMEPEEIIEGLATYSTGDMRLNIKNINGITVLNDAYNASPNSMEAALEVLKELGGGLRTIAVLGDMLELGEWASDAHYEIGKFAALKGIDYIVSTGRYSEKLCEGALSAGFSKQRLLRFDDNAQIINYLKGFLKKGDVVLVKGSRAMKMEEVANFLYQLDFNENLPR